MSQAMVDRLFWRAGFGPTAADRAAWIGKPLDDAVDSLLNTPQGALVGPDPTRDGKALDPTGDDTDLVLAWVDRMVRTPNPLVERMTFFWHRHWANSRMSVSPTQLLITQNALLRKYGDFGANPDVTFRDMALEVTKDPSMLRYLNGESNVKGGPNENYGREFMELFTLGVNHAITGAKNYSENDVAQLAKSFTGCYIDDKDPDNVKALFDSGRWFNGPKSIFGKLGNYNADSVVDLVLTPRQPRAVHRQEAVERVHAHAAPDARRCSSSRPTTRPAAARSSRSCAASSRTRSSSSRSTSRT